MLFILLISLCCIAKKKKKLNTLSRFVFIADISLIVKSHKLIDNKNKFLKNYDHIFLTG